MKTCLPLLAGLCVLGASAAPATTSTPWDDPDTPYLAPVSDDGLGEYDAGLGVDPIYSTPSIYEESGQRTPSFIPNDVYLEYFGNMSFNGGPGRVQVTNALINLPLVNPQRAAWKGWHLDVKGTLRLTWLDCEGRNLLDEDNLYTLGVQASLSHALGRKGQLHLGVAPQFSSDFDVMSHHNFYFGAYAAYSSQLSDTLRYTIGLACMPDSYRSVVMPMLSLQWQYSPAWELRMEGARLSCVCTAREHFHWGPFFQWNTGVWTVHRNRQTQQFRMNNAILGLGTSYDRTLSGGRSMSFLGDVGCSFNNTFRVRDASGEHTLEKYRTHPGLYVRLGLRMAF